MNVEKVTPPDLSPEDSETMRRWFAGEATEDEMGDVVRRHIAASIPSDRTPPGLSRTSGPTTGDDRG